jgi:hypothetical protein
MSVEEFGRTRSWPIYKYYPGIRLERLRTITKTPYLSRLFVGRFSNWGAPTYERSFTAAALRDGFFLSFKLAEILQGSLLNNNEKDNNTGLMMVELGSQ